MESIQDELSRETAIPCSMRTRSEGAPGNGSGMMLSKTQPKPQPKTPPRTPPKTPAGLEPALLARFAAIVGDKHAITDPQAQAPYLIEMRDMFHGRTPVVRRPGAVAEVAQIL